MIEWESRLDDGALESESRPGATTGHGILAPLRIRSTILLNVKIL